MASLTLADRTHVPKSCIKNKNNQLLPALEEAGAKQPRMLGVGEGAGGSLWSSEGCGVHCGPVRGWGALLWSSEGRYPGLLGKVRADLEQCWAALGQQWAQAGGCTQTPMGGVTAAGPWGCPGRSSRDKPQCWSE